MRCIPPDKQYDKSGDNKRKLVSTNNGNIVGEEETREENEPVSEPKVRKLYNGAKSSDLERSTPSQPDAIDDPQESPIDFTLYALAERILEKVRAQFGNKIHYVFGALLTNQQATHMYEEWTHANRLKAKSEQARKQKLQTSNQIWRGKL